MTSKALVIKTSSRPPQPLLARLMSVRGGGRPQSPASRHIAACLLPLCYFHWFLNRTGRLFKAKMKSMRFKGQKWPHPPAWLRHERIHLSCRSDLQLPLRSCDGRIVTHNRHWIYTAHPISADESVSKLTNSKVCQRCNLHSNTSAKSAQQKSYKQTTKLEKQHHLSVHLDSSRKGSELSASKMEMVEVDFWFDSYEFFAKLFSETSLLIVAVLLLYKLHWSSGLPAMSISFQDMCVRNAEKI